MNQNLYIIWNNDNNLGIPIIDEQHRGLISTINSLYFYTQAGIDDLSIKPILMMLQQYTDIHFKTEEAFLKKANYPDIKEHINLHRKLAENTKKISLDNSMEQDPENILKFLKNWWLGHIKKEDRKYLPYLVKFLQ